MFYNTYKKKINNCYINDNVIYNKIVLRCCLCLEDDNMDLFYNYENNKFIHNCKCTPNIHYKCFKSLDKSDPANVIKFNVANEYAVKLFKNKPDHDYTGHFFNF